MKNHEAVSVFWYRGPPGIKRRRSPIRSSRDEHSTSFPGAKQAETNALDPVRAPTRLTACDSRLVLHEQLLLGSKVGILHQGAKFSHSGICYHHRWEACGTRTPYTVPQARKKGGTPPLLRNAFFFLRHSHAIFLSSATSVPFCFYRYLHHTVCCTETSSTPTPPYACTQSGSTVVRFCPFSQPPLANHTF